MLSDDLCEHVNKQRVTLHESTQARAPTMTVQIGTTDARDKADNIALRRVGGSARQRAFSGGRNKMQTATLSSRSHSLWVDDTCDTLGARGSTEELPRLAIQSEAKAAPKLAARQPPARAPLSPVMFVKVARNCPRLVCYLRPLPPPPLLRGTPKRVDP